MMKPTLLIKKFNRGLTLIEMVVVMSITSLAGLGLVSSVITIVGFYQDDIVLRDIRNYGSAALNVIADSIQTAKTISATTGPNGYDIVRLKYHGDPRTYSIQATETDGFLWGNQPLLDGIPFQSGGTYRLNDQRKMYLESFEVNNLIDAEYEPIQNKNRLTAVAKSVYEVSIVFGLITKYADGNELTEYVTFRKKVYAYQNLINRI